MQTLKSLLRNFNTFQSQQFFRFQGETQFTNVLGGVFTVLIRGLLAVLLIIKLYGVFTFTKVNSTRTSINQIISVNQTLSPASSKSPFLVAFQVVQTPKTIDDSVFKSNSRVYTQNTSNTYVFLEQCKPSHWAAVAPAFFQNITNIYKDKSSILYCLPLNYTHQMSIQQTATLQIAYLYTCRTANCSTVGQVQMQVRPIIFNTLINSQDSTQYLANYLDKKTYYPLDSWNNGFDTVLQHFMQNYQIITDNSLMPWASYTTETGFYYPQQPFTSYRPSTFYGYVFFRMFFQLNVQQDLHQRNFNKIFDAISQIGGLIPVFMLGFIWLKYYALSHFEMTFIKKLHSDQKAKQYGIFYFFSKFFYSVLTFFNINMDHWDMTRQYHKMHNTVNKLIDIIYLYKRLDFIERVIEVLLDDHQLKVLHLMRNKTFKEAENNTKLYEMKDNLSKIVEKHKVKDPLAAPTLESAANLREISLQPNPLSSQHNVQPLKSDKPFINSGILDGDQDDWRKKGTPPPLFRQIDLTPHKSGNQNNNNNNQEDSQYNQEVQNQQIKALRQAYTSYEMLRRQAEDTNSEYYNFISRNILKKLDNVDRRLLDDLEMLLQERERETIIAQVIFALNNKQSENMGSIYKKGSKLMDTHRQNRSNILHSSIIRNTGILNSDHKRRT